MTKFDVSLKMRDPQRDPDINLGTFNFTAADLDATPLSGGAGVQLECVFAAYTSAGLTPPEFVDFSPGTVTTPLALADVYELEPYGTNPIDIPSSAGASWGLRCPTRLDDRGLCIECSFEFWRYR